MLHGACPAIFDIWLELGVGIYWNTHSHTLSDTLRLRTQRTARRVNP